MESKTYFAAIKLKEEIHSCEEFIELLINEKEMENNDEVIFLAYQVDQKATRYSDSIKLYDEQSKEVVEARRELFLAKKELEEHEIVRKYLKSYQGVRLILDEINNILFKDISINLCKKSESKWEL